MRRFLRFVIVFALTISLPQLIKAEDSPVITVGIATGSITTCNGSPSIDILQFVASGTGLSASINIIAPIGFEVSLDAQNGFSSNTVLTPAAGTLNQTIVYVRSSATASSGYQTGSVTLSSPKAASQTVSVAATIYALPAVNTVANQVVNNGDYTAAVNFTGTANSYLWSNNTTSIGLSATGSGNIPPFVATNSGTIPVIATVSVTPVSSAYAYVINFGANAVLVLNALTGAVITTIPVGSGPTNILRGLDGGKVYVTNTIGNVSVISTATNMVIATLPVGNYPGGMCQSPDGSLIYVANPGLYNTPAIITVISAKTNIVITTIPVSTSVTGIAVSPDGSKLYLANGSENSVSVINSMTYVLIATTPAGAEVNQISISPDGSQLYLPDEDNDHVIVISTEANAVIATIPVGPGPYGLTVSPDGQKVYVNNTGDATVAVINTKNNTVSSLISVGIGPYALSFSTDGSKLYVVNNGANSISVIDPIGNKVVETLPINIRNVDLSGIILEGGGCAGAPATFTVQVNPTSATAKITASVPTGNNATCQGQPSSNPNIQQFIVSASGLTADLTATAPAGFDISEYQASDFGKTLTIVQSGGNVNSTTIYVRSSASAPAGVQSDYVTLASPGTASQHVVVTGTVTPEPYVAPIPNQTVLTGAITTAVTFTGAANAYNWTNDHPGIGLASEGTGSIPEFIATNTSNNPVTATITVTPASLAYAYITNANSNSVSVIDIKTGNVVATIPVNVYPTGVAVNSDGSMAYVSCRDSKDIAVISSLTNTVIYTIDTGQISPFFMTLSPDGQRLYVTDDGSYVVTVIDIASSSVIGSFFTSIRPEGVAISPDGQSIYVANGGANTVSVVNSKNYTVANTIAVGMHPNGITISPNGQYLYVTNAASNTVSVIDMAANTITNTITVQNGPIGIVISPDASKLYVVNGGGNSNSVSVISTLTNTVVNTITVGINPTGISISKDGSEVFVTNSNSENVSIINAADNSVITNVTVGQLPLSYGNFITGGIPCMGTPVKFTITVDPVPDITPLPMSVIIPNTFTPNGDGINDTWDIRNLDAYPNCTVQIFSRWGQNLYSSVGYPVPWNGTYSGSALPAGTYYYIINLKNGSGLLSGYVAIIR